MGCICVTAVQFLKPWHQVGVATFSLFHIDFFHKGLDLYLSSCQKLSVLKMLKRALTKC